MAYYLIIHPDGKTPVKKVQVDIESDNNYLSHEELKKMTDQEFDDYIEGHNHKIAHDNYRDYGLDDKWYINTRKRYIKQRLKELWELRLKSNTKKGIDKEIRSLKNEKRLVDYKKNNSEQIDIEDLKKVSIEKILNNYGIQVIRGTFKIRDERTPSCRYYKDSNSWYDFGAGCGGSNIDLIMAVEKCDLKSAIRLLTKFYTML